MSLRNRWLTIVLTSAVGFGLAGMAKADLVGYWSFDDTVADQSGNGRDGTNLLNVAYSPDTPSVLDSSKSLVLGGATRVDIPADPALNSQPFTLAYWFNQNGIAQNGTYERVTSRGSDTFETAVSSDGSLRYYPSPTGWQDTGVDLSASGWQHVVFSSDGGNMRVYVDGALEYTGQTNANRSGILRIGARDNIWTEGIDGLIDDVAVWDNPLPPAAVQTLADGGWAPNELVITTVTSDPNDWALSTVRRSGGAAGTWTPPGDPLPDASTFTLPASPTPVAGIVAAAADLGLGTLLGDGGDSQPAGLQYYRTTFDLDPFKEISAQITLAVDNGAQVFINGQEVARETSYLTENWARPYSTLSINPDGSISDVTLFDQTFSFTGWLVGENEVVLAIRNPDSEGLIGGGLAFRMDVVSTVPEPGAVCLLGLGGLCLLGYARWRKRRR